MAERRSFTKKITESDAFMDLPLSSQCLYFHLNMNTDDDGFVNNPKRIMRVIGANEDDLKLLIAKSFVLVFDSGVIVIKHFRMHNTLRNDRYHPTSYQEEFKMLGLKDNESYTWKPNGNQLETEHNITKHNITEHNNIRHKYGAYNNVLLSDDEMEKLQNEFPDWKGRIERVSEYCASTGRSYKNYLATIRAWSKKEKPHSEEKMPVYDQSKNVRLSKDEMDDLLKLRGDKNA